ncbi:MAG: aspartate 1-decarboxylase [Bacteroidales bacterium]
MEIEVLKSKVHRARVTDANLNYTGSITIDENWMLKAGIYEFEKVQVLNINNGERFETYVIKGEKSTHDIILNGAAARKVQTGDLVIIMAYTRIDSNDHGKINPKITNRNTGSKNQTKSKLMN